MEHLLKIQNLNLEFSTSRGKVHALRDINITIPKNKIIGIVGESGSGKSTILWSILGLLSANANITSGEILFKDKNILEFTEQQKARLRGEEISMVFQDPMNSQIPVLTYSQQMLDILYRRQALSTKQKKTSAISMLSKVSIPDADIRINFHPHHFSGGMRQRAGIAMGMLTTPDLLLADEPTTALDVTMEAQIIQLMKNLQSELQTSILIVSHNLGLIAELCDEVLVMYAGEIVESGSVEDIFYQPKHPYTKALLECDPARIKNTNQKLPVIFGNIPDLINPPKACIYQSRCHRSTEICAQIKPSLSIINSTSVYCHNIEEADSKESHPQENELEDKPAIVNNEKVKHNILDIQSLNVSFKTMGFLKSILTPNQSSYVDVLLDINLSINKGETLGLVGESGSGKTTLGRTILNLTPAKSGSIKFHGEEILNYEESKFRKIRRNIAMMFQDPIGSLSPRKTVRSIITEPFEIHNQEFAAINLDKKAQELCDLVKLPKQFLSRYPHQLSGGQARRVGVARALALNPQLIIADEPTAGLDVSVQGEILNLLTDLQNELQLSYLIITHNLPVIKHISDRIAVIYLGRVIEIGKTDDVFNRPAHPYSKALIEGIPKPEPRKNKTQFILQGDVPSILNRPKGCDFHTRCPYAQEICKQQFPKPVTLENNHILNCHFSLISS